MVTSMIFFPEKSFYETPASYGLDWEDVQFETSDHVRLHGWYLRAPREKGVLLFSHGNAGNISHRLFKIKGWIDRGFTVFLYDYRGYGQSEGSIKYGDDLLRDEGAAFRYLAETKHIPIDKVILYGESIGTYPAIRLGNEYKVGAVILEAPFTSFKDLAGIHYSVLPPFALNVLLRDFEFSNEAYIHSLKAPVFILHGDKDEICPYQMGSDLYGKAHEPKELFTVPNGQHNDLPFMAGDAYWQKPYEFILKILDPQGK
ncbi:MAG: alpha/beta hydrolase [Candidatus Omnitrophica bacterium]|nr:alpha/beta hydrolase [Candidatus Omnitrophota bacterium]